MYISKFEENNKEEKKMLWMEEVERTMTCQENTVAFFCCCSCLSFLFSLLAQPLLTWQTLLSQNKSSQILAVTEKLQGLAGSVSRVRLYPGASEPPALHDSSPEADTEQNPVTSPLLSFFILI